MFTHEKLQSRDGGEDVGENVELWMAVTDVVDVCHDDSGKIDSVDGGVDCDVDFSEDGGKDGVKVE